MFNCTHQSCPLDTVAVDEAEKKETDSGQNSHLHTHVTNHQDICDLEISRAADRLIWWVALWEEGLCEVESKGQRLNCS